MKYPIVILHGWRLRGSRYKDIQELFQKKGFTVYALDLPGSADVKLTKEVMRIDDYIDFVLDFLKEQKIKKIILIGHSFGGRVAAKFAATYPGMVEKLILTGAPLIKQELSLKKKIIVFSASIIKKTLKLSFVTDRMRKVLYYLLGEWDYYKASKDIRETFKAIIAEDIAQSLPFIRVPTLVLWGEQDTFVSKKVGKQIVKKIPSAEYQEISGASHKLPYEEPKKFADAVLEFIH